MAITGRILPDDIILSRQARAVRRARPQERALLARLFARSTTAESPPSTRLTTASAVRELGSLGGEGRRAAGFVRGGGSSGRRASLYGYGFGGSKKNRGMIVADTRRRTFLGPLFCPREFSDERCEMARQVSVPLADRLIVERTSAHETQMSLPLVSECRLQRARRTNFRSDATTQRHSLPATRRCFLCLQQHARAAGMPRG